MKREKTSKTRKTFKIIFMSLRILSVIVLAGAVLLGGALVVPHLFGITPYTVTTESMEPTIPKGAMAYVNTNNKTPEADDVIAFQMTNGAMVIHRVVEVQRHAYTTKGDANSEEDFAPVGASQVVGICVFHVPVLGYLFLDPAFKYIWIAIAAGAFICLLVLRIERIRFL